MKLVSKLSIATGVIALAIVPFAYAVDVSQLYVNDSAMGGWADLSVDGGYASYVDGAPTGFTNTSLELKTDTGNFAARAAYGRSDFSNITQLTKLGYWARQVSSPNMTNNARIEIALDLNQDTINDTTLVYTPYKQVGAQVQSNVWQYWDATNGLFTSTQNFGTADSALRNDGTTYTLSQISAWYPTATVQALGIMIGTDMPSTVVDVDGVTIGTSTYDFERVIPESPSVVDVPKTVQDCKKYGWETLFTNNNEPFKNQGQCVSYIVSSKAKLK